MKTTTVRELRNHFADVAKWLENGESVTITRHGAAFAVLSPATTETNSSVDWAKRLQRYKPVGRGMSHAATEQLWSDLRD
ncbi:MAG: type II toxin-antitoxin system Phd/YefM family antitoxin [Verrucomicrobium sp.]|nr:type II toxin-antitoxin system prevent-host-death family antitoxin [Verrucomicrobium sp.]